MIIINRNHDRSVGFGVALYFHRHRIKQPIHFHILITVLFWFVEIGIGKEYSHDWLEEVEG